MQFEPELGVEVIATGRITTWSKYKTTYQLDIEKLEIAGEGALLKLIEDRKRRLKERRGRKVRKTRRVVYPPKP